MEEKTMFRNLREKLAGFIRKHIVDDIPPHLDDEANYGFMIADVSKAENVHPELVLRLGLAADKAGIACRGQKELRALVKEFKAHLRGRDVSLQTNTPPASDNGSPAQPSAERKFLHS